VPELVLSAVSSLTTMRSAFVNWNTAAITAAIIAAGISVWAVSTLAILTPLYDIPTHCTVTDVA